MTTGEGAADAFVGRLEGELDELRRQGTARSEIVLTGPQRPRTTTAVEEVLNLCSNNYLGLAADPRIVEAAGRALASHGAGMASVRFICGTQDEHRALEAEIAAFLGYEDAIVQMSCWDANGGLFGALLGPDDVVLSDALNHASIIDGVRLAKARGVVYRHSDLEHLRELLLANQHARTRVIATDGLFSMEGELAALDGIVTLADEFDAIVMVDDSHGVGVVGPTGRGTAEHFGLGSRIDIQTGTFGKALGGAAGGCTVARGPVIEMLRQRSRTYLFSNALPPPVVAAARAALRILSEDPGLLERLRANTARIRSGMTAEGFDVFVADHPVVAVMVGGEVAAMELARAVRGEGVLLVAFSHPVVPRGEARIRVQLSAAHEDTDIDRAVAAFVTVRATRGPGGMRAART